MTIVLFRKYCPAAADAAELAMAVVVVAVAVSIFFAAAAVIVADVGDDNDDNNSKWMRAVCLSHGNKRLHRRFSYFHGLRGRKNAFAAIKHFKRGISIKSRYFKIYIMAARYYKSNIKRGILKVN